MNLQRTVHSLAIAVAILSTHANQANSQTPESLAACEAFTAIVEARDNSTIVSGIRALETGIVPFQNLEPGELPNTFYSTAQILVTDTPHLTLPSGTLTPFGIAAVPFIETTNTRNTFKEGDIFTMRHGPDRIVKEGFEAILVTDLENRILRKGIWNMYSKCRRW